MTKPISTILRAQGDNVFSLIQKATVQKDFEVLSYALCHLQRDLKNRPFLVDTVLATGELLLASPKASHIRQAAASARFTNRVSTPNSDTDWRTADTWNHFVDILAGRNVPIAQEECHAALDQSAPRSFLHINAYDALSSLALIESTDILIESRNYVRADRLAASAFLHVPPNSARAELIVDQRAKIKELSSVHDKKWAIAIISKAIQKGAIVDTFDAVPVRDPYPDYRLPSVEESMNFIRWAVTRKKAGSPNPL